MMLTEDTQLPLKQDFQLEHLGQVRWEPLDIDGCRPLHYSDF